MSRTARGWAGLLIMGLLVVAGCSRSPEAQKARYLERGDKYAAREQYREAIIEYLNVLRYDPANTRAIRQLGLAHSQLGELAQGFRFLLKAQELTPDDLAKGDVAQAEREFKAAADIAPVGSPARLKLADFYLSAQKPDEAKRILSEMTQKAPDFLPAWRRLAELALRERNYDESLKNL